MVKVGQRSEDFALPPEEAVQKSIQGLQKAGKTRDVTKLETYIKLAESVNKDILSQISHVKPTERQETLRKLSKTLETEISAHKDFREKLEGSSADIWIGKVMTRLLYLAQKVLVGNPQQKELAKEIEAAEHALSKDATPKELEDHLTKITTLREKVPNKGAIFDLSTLIEARLIFHMVYAEGQNPYQQMSKTQQAEIFLTQGTKKPEQELEPHESFKQLKLSEFEAAARDELKPTPGFKIEGLRADQIVEELGIILVSGQSQTDHRQDLSRLERLLEQFKDHPGLFDSVEGAVYKFPQIEKMLTSNSTWQEVAEHRRVTSAISNQSKLHVTRRNSDDMQVLVQQLKSGEPLKVDFWKGWAQIPEQQRKNFVNSSAFNDASERLLTEAESLSGLVGDKVLLTIALPFVEELLGKEKGELTSPFIEKFGNLEGEHLRKQRDVQKLLKMPEDPLEAAIHQKGLERLGQHVLEDLNERRESKTKLYTFAHDQGNIRKDLALLEALDKEGIKGAKANLARYNQQVSELELLSNPKAPLAPETAGSSTERRSPLEKRVTELRHKLNEATTYQELEKLEKELDSLGDTKKAQDDLRRLDDDPRKAQKLREDIHQLEADHERLTKDLKTKITKQKQALGELAMIFKERSIKKVKDFKKLYNAEVAQPKQEIERLMDLEKGWALTPSNNQQIMKERTQALQRLAKLAATQLNQASLVAPHLGREYREKFLTFFNSLNPPADREIAKGIFEAQLSNK